MNRKRLFLVDVSSMFFRAFYAIRSLSAPSGLPVNAIYGFLSMIIKLLKEEKPDYFVFCYDRKEPSFRKDIFPEYKANRSEMPDDLQKQMPYLMKIAPLLGIPALEVPGYEADDIIGSMVDCGLQHNLDVTIVSGDKDFGQLIQDHVVMYDTMKNIRYNVDEVKNKWGIRPSQFISYLAIVGDTSDNIPGVTGIGPKGALKLFEQFESIEEIYDNLEKIESKSVKSKLESSRDQAFLSKKLVTIVRNIPLSQNLDDYRMKTPKSEELLEFLKELNFKSFEKTLFENGLLHKSQDAELPEKNNLLSLTTTTEKLKPTQDHEKTLKTTVLQKLPSQPLASLSVISENSGVDIRYTELNLSDLLVQIESKSELWGFLFNDQIYLGSQIGLSRVKEISTESLRTLDEKKMIWKGYDLKSLWHQMKILTANANWDSQIAANITTSLEMSEFFDVYKKFFGDLLFAESTPVEIYQAHLKLANYLETTFSETEKKLFDEIELPLIAVLLKMESKGITIDLEFLSVESDTLRKEIQTIEKKVQELAGETFNVASPKQLSQILFEKLKLPTQKKTKTGFSTDNEVLEKIEHPIAKEMLLYRELSKLKSTYVDALPLLVNSETHRVHTSFNQTVTTTGRLSSTNPNLQNIPIRTERGRRVRKAFVAPLGQKLLSMDYSQIELRILAHISRDPGLSRAFLEDLDVHQLTAAEVFGVPLDKVTSDQRRSAKAVNFGIAYGQGATGLSQNLGVPRKEAQGIIDRYFERFSGVKEYIHSTITLAHEKGYVETLMGRRRYLSDLKSGNAMIRRFGERAAINAPIQGSASDIVKKAMILIDQNIPVSMLLQVHDELIFEGTSENLEQNLPAILKIMETVVPLHVPLKVNYSMGINWDDAH